MVMNESIVIKRHITWSDTKNIWPQIRGEFYLGKKFSFKNLKKRLKKFQRSFAKKNFELN